MYKHGLTMVEILAVMLIISVVSSVALPAIDNFRSSDRCKAEASKFVDSIRQAKYQAMQENCLNRIKFSDDGDFYQIERYKPDTSLAFDDIIKADNSIIGSRSSERYDSNNWESIGDEEIIDFDSSVEVDLANFSEKIIYFKPDGYIYKYNNNNDAEPIPEYEIYFKYGSAEIKVILNSLGVLSSEAIARSDDDDTDTNNELPELPGLSDPSGPSGPTGSTGPYNPDVQGEDVTGGRYVGQEFGTE